MTLDELIVRYAVAVLWAHDGHQMLSAKYMGVSVRTIRIYARKAQKDFPEIKLPRIIKGRIDGDSIVARTERMERERQRLLDLQDSYYSRKYKVRGA